MTDRPVMSIPPTDPRFTYSKPEDIAAFLETKIVDAPPVGLMLRLHLSQLGLSVSHVRDFDFIDRKEAPYHAWYWNRKIWLRPAANKWHFDDHGAVLHEMAHYLVAFYESEEKARAENYHMDDLGTDCVADESAACAVQVFWDAIYRRPEDAITTAHQLNMVGNGDETISEDFQEARKYMEEAGLDLPDMNHQNDRLRQISELLGVLPTQPWHRATMPAWRASDKETPWER